MVVNGESFQSSAVTIELHGTNIVYLMVGLRYGFYPGVTDATSRTSEV